MPQDHRAIRFIILGLVLALILLVISLGVTVLFYWSTPDRPSGTDIAGVATISAAVLAVVGVLGAYLGREQKKPD